MGMRFYKFVHICRAQSPNSHSLPMQCKHDWKEGITTTCTRLSCHVPVMYARSMRAEATTQIGYATVLRLWVSGETCTIQYFIHIAYIWSVCTSSILLHFVFAVKLDFLFDQFACVHSSFAAICWHSCSAECSTNSKLHYATCNTSKVVKHSISTKHIRSGAHTTCISTYHV